MKQTLSRLLLTGIVIAAFASSFSFTPPATQTVQSIRPIHPTQSILKQPVTTSYIWFMDFYLTVPTGTICDIGAEIGRLSSIFPANVFTTEASTNVHPYEYGYALLQPWAVIYSDR